MSPDTSCMAFSKGVEIKNIAKIRKKNKFNTVTFFFNVFVKPNDQRELAHFGMARKRHLKKERFFTGKRTKRGEKKPLKH